MSEITLTDVERLGAFDTAERTFQMDEEAFRAFYELTARPLWAFLARTTGDNRLADDLLQETYYRFLRTRTAFESDDHRRHYLFRVAANLVRDHWRRSPLATFALAEERVARVDRGTAERESDRIDVARALQQLKPRERTLLWLAYAQGLSHDEIAGVLGLKTASLKMMLYRARQRLARLLPQHRTKGERS
jgi:RNA polymerase sigma-70 factor, ECF subfamily